MLKPIVQTVMIRVQLLFSCGQNFCWKRRLKVRASDIWHTLAVHFSRRGTLLAGQYLYHVKTHPLNGNNTACGRMLVYPFHVLVTCCLIFECFLFNILQRATWLRRNRTFGKRCSSSSSVTSSTFKTFCPSFPTSSRSTTSKSVLHQTPNHLSRSLPLNPRAISRFRDHSHISL